MPTNKDFKRLVRGRMQKTGEAYTTARAHLLKQKPRKKPAEAPSAAAKSAAAASASQYATLAGKSDAAVKAATGCTWDRWVKALDRVKAHTWPHRKIAEHVHAKYKVPGWWAQTVTVGYERIKGLRAIGQRRDGSFEATKSKTFPAPLARLYDAFEARGRARWLPGVDLTVRKSTREKYMRITWADATSVEVGFSSRGASKSQVAIQHSKLPSQAEATRLKEYWTERLDALKEVLAAE